MSNFYEHGNEPSDATKAGKFDDKLHKINNIIKSHWAISHVNVKLKTNFLKTSSFSHQS